MNPGDSILSPPTEDRALLSRYIPKDFYLFIRMLGLRQTMAGDDS